MRALASTVPYEMAIRARTTQVCHLSLPNHAPNCGMGLCCFLRLFLSTLVVLWVCGASFLCGVVEIVRVGVWNMDHTVVHFEIPANDVEKLRKFYSKLFGWKIEKALGPVEYWMIGTVPVDDKMMPLRPGVNGGMYKKERPENKPVNYISVESIEKSIEQVKALGGKVVQGKQEVMGVGWIAVAVDPEGNQIAMLQPMRV